MNRRALRWCVVVVAATMIPLGLTACGVSGGNGSRHHIYQSLNELISDSTTIVEVVVEDQNTFAATDSTSAHTVSEAMVATAAVPLGLALTNESSVLTPKVGSMISVRQLGEPGSRSDTPYLKGGGQYLLFLTPTMLPGAASNEFYVTGGVAGIYEFNGDIYVRASKDGDRIPEELTVEELTK